MTTKVKELLQKKDANVVCISQEKTVYEAIKLLVNHNIGAVLVLDENEKLVLEKL